MPALAQTNANYFKPIPPCRVIDTRGPVNGGVGGPSLLAGVTREFPIVSTACGVPLGATAYSLNVTVVPKEPLAFLRVWRADIPMPVTSLLNSVDGRVKANAAIVPSNPAEGTINFVSRNDTDLIVDVNGYFMPEATGGTFAFYPLTPCRAADTRLAAGVLGGPSLSAGQARLFPINSSGCGAPASAAAYVLNVTAVPHGPLGYLTLWSNNGQGAPPVSTLNAPTGQITANMAIVQPGPDGQINAIATNDSDLVIDVLGYFAAPGSGGLAFSQQPFCRAFDSRESPGTPLSGGSTTEVQILGGSCGVPNNAQGVLVNATVVPSGPLGYLTIYGDQGGGETPVPPVSTLNALDGQITSNFAILPTAPGAADDVFVSNPTHVVLDVYGFWSLP